MTDNNPKLWLGDIPVPGRYGHKYHRGHVGVFSGGLASTGAARLAAGAALRIGAGLVTLLSPKSALLTNASHLTAIMLKALDDPHKLPSLIKERKIDTLIGGPGLGVGQHTVDLITQALSLDCANVLDADALTSFSNDSQTLFSLLKQAKHQSILTPHMGEFCHLFGGSNTDNLDQRIERAMAASMQCGSVIVLKGHQTIIAAPDQPAVISQNAPPWLATAGSGDVLAGIIAGLLAQKMPPQKAAMAGVWLHGEAGNHAGPGLTSEDLDQALHQVIIKLHHDISN